MLYNVHDVNQVISALTVIRRNNRITAVQSVKTSSKLQFNTQLVSKLGKDNRTSATR